MYHLNVDVKNICIDTFHQDIVVKKTCGKPVVVGNLFSTYEVDGDELLVSELRAKSMGVLEDRTLVDFGVRLNTRIMRRRDLICLFLPDHYCTHLKLVTHSGNIGIYGVKFASCDIQSRMGDVEIMASWMKKLCLNKDNGDVFLRGARGDEAIISNLNGYTGIERSLFQSIQVNSLDGDIDTFLPTRGFSYDICTSTSGKQFVDPYVTGNDSLKLSLKSECGDIKVACKKFLF